MIANQKKKKAFWDAKTISLYAIMIPALIYFIVYRYLPIGGLVMVFEKFRLARGIWGSPWVGFENFIKLFQTPTWPTILTNTVTISLLKLVIGFPAPIIVALMLNEVKKRWFKRTLQTTLYLPHFLSWVILGGLIFTLFGPTSGAFSKIYTSLTGKQLKWLIDSNQFIGLLVISDVWKEVGWNSIIYLAALTSIDAQMYEAALIDGASKRQQLLFITLPTLIPTIMTMLILRVGRVLNAGFEQIFVLQNSLVYNASEVIDTFVYKLAFAQGQHGMAAAAGLFKSVIGLILVLITNKIAASVDKEVL